MKNELKYMIFSLAGLMSVSGHTTYSEEELMELIGGYFDETIVSPLKNYTFIRRCGKENAKKILIDTHFDEIGMIVTGIKDGGFLTVTNVGGLDTRILQASEVVVYCRDKKEIYGVVGSTPPHLQRAGDADKLVPIDELLIDTGYSKEELQKHVSIGTPVGFMPKYSELKNGFIAGKGFDDKACGAIAALALAQTPADELWGDVYLQFSNFEESGSYMSGAATGAFATEPDCALVADVDLGRTPDTKDSETVKVGAGPSIAFSPLTDKRLTRIIESAAKENGVPTQRTVAPSGTGTNTNVIGLVGRGIPTVDVGLPLKSMHTCAEVISLDDAEALCKLIKLFITSPEVEKAVKEMSEND